MPQSPAPTRFLQTSAWVPLLMSGVTLTLVSAVLGLTEGARGAPRSPPRGVVHGWVSPTAARVLLPGSVCAGDDALMSLTLSGALEPTPRGHEPGSDLVLVPPAVVATGAAIDRGKEVAVLDLGAGLDGRGSPRGARAVPTFSRATARCRSWSERSWELGSLSVSAVDAALGPAPNLTVEDAPVLSAYVVPEPHHTGVLAILLVHSYEQPVELVSIQLGHGTARAVLAASGWMEHWPAWEEEALDWLRGGRSTAPSGVRRRSDPGSAVAGSAADPAPVTEGPEGTMARASAPGPAPSLAPTDPAPALTWRPVDDLGLRLEPYNAAAIVIGEWTFDAAAAQAEPGALARAWHGLRDLVSPRPDVVLSFPVLSYAAGGAETTVGMTEAVYAELP